MRPFAVFGLVLMASMAGCIDDDAPPAPDDTAGGHGGVLPDLDGDGNLLVAAPSWSVRDYWVYEDSFGVRSVFVVTEETATDWIMDTDAETFAFFDAVNDLSTLGPQRKSDLAGSQDSSRVEFFQWPLADAASWDTTWDGEAVTITSSEQGPGVFTMEARDAVGNLSARYGYDVSSRWFSWLEFYRSGPEPVYRYQLVEKGTNWTGEAVRFVIENVFHADEPGGPTSPTEVRLVQFDQGDQHDDVYLSVSFECTLPGVFHFLVNPSEPGDDVGFNSNEACPKSVAFRGSIGSAPGGWGITLIRVTPGEIVSYQADIWLRTRVPIAVG